MRAVVQRVTRSAVRVENKETAKIGRGLLVLLAVARGDSREDAAYLAEKIAHLRIFEDGRDKMNRSLLDITGEVLVVSQFTLMGDCRKGRRPSFTAAAPPEQANTLYAHFAELLGEKGLGVSTGRFGTMMQVSLINDGPVTLILESR